MYTIAFFFQPHLNLYVYLESFHYTFYINHSDLFPGKITCSVWINSDHKYMNSYLCAWILASQQSGQVCLHAKSTFAGNNVAVLQTSGPRVGDHIGDNKSSQGWLKLLGQEGTTSPFSDSTTINFTSIQD